MRIQGSNVVASAPADLRSKQERVNSAVVDAAEEMAKHKFGFPKTPANSKMNPDFWVLDGKRENATFAVRPGVKPSDAIKDITQHPERYSFDCATACVIVFHKAILKLIGPARFDKAMGSDMRIGPWTMDPVLADSYMHGQLNSRYGEGQPSTGNDFATKMPKGAQGYIAHWGANDSEINAGHPGENVIALGGGRVYGHPFGITTPKDIERFYDRMDKRMNRENGWASSPTNQKAQLSVSVLDL